MKQLVKLLKDPFLHFFVIGAMLFVTYLWLNPNTLADDSEIVVNADRIEQLRTRFERTWGRAPSYDELTGIIDNFVVEEILYRQALAMGLDSNDSVIRRRLRQKMEFLTMEAIRLEQPSTADLTQYLVQNPGQFQTPARFSFEQIYINTDQPAAHWKAQIDVVQKQLLNGAPATGSNSLIPKRFEETSDHEIDSLFGAGFADGLAKLTLDQWSDPLQSGLGLHIIRLTAYQPARLPTLASVQEAVTREWRNARNLQMKTDLMERLKANYTIVIELEQPHQNEGDS